MSNEFEKLDAFMRKHAPPKKEVRAMIQPLKSKNWILNGAFALSLAFIVTGTVLHQQQTRNENALVLSQVLEWDVTSDEMPSEIEEVIAFAE